MCLFSNTLSKLTDNVQAYNWFVYFQNLQWRWIRAGWTRVRRTWISNYSEESRTSSRKSEKRRYLWLFHQRHWFLNWKQLQKYYWLVQNRKWLVDRSSINIIYWYKRFTQKLTSDDGSIQFVMPRFESLSKKLHTSIVLRRLSDSKLWRRWWSDDRFNLVSTSEEGTCRNKSDRFWLVSW